MTVRITNEILYDIADLADNIEENFGSQYADVFEQEVKEILQNLGDRFNQYPGTEIFYRGSEIRKIVMRPSIALTGRRRLRNGIYSRRGKTAASCFRCGNLSGLSSFTDVPER